MPEIGKYIYGIINSNKKRAFGTSQIMDRNVKVYTIPYKDISAVVSDSEIIDFNYMLKESVARLLVEHQKVVERIMPDYTIIPMRLGTIAKDEIEVEDILHKGYNLIKEILEKIDGKIEIDVVGTLSDFSSILKEAGEEEEIKEFKQKLLANPKGVTIEDQMKVGVMVKKALDKKKGKYAEDIKEALKGFGQEYRVHDVMDDTMVINTAFLINKEWEKDFYRKLEELNAGFNERLNFRCVGPLPPYSFYTLEAKKMEFPEIDWARKKLSLLSDTATRGQIKKAHQALALASHPDKNPDRPGIEKEFDEGTRAYRILLDYCLAAEQGGRGDSCSFKEEEFSENSVLVKVKEG